MPRIREVSRPAQPWTEDLADRPRLLIVDGLQPLALWDAAAIEDLMAYSDFQSEPECHQRIVLADPTLSSPQLRNGRLRLGWQEYLRRADQNLNIMMHDVRAGIIDALTYRPTAPKVSINLYTKEWFDRFETVSAGWQAVLRDQHYPLAAFRDWDMDSRKTLAEHLMDGDFQPPYVSTIGREPQELVLLEYADGETWSGTFDLIIG